MMQSRMEREFTAVVAVDEAWCIGKGGEIPWRLSEDLKQFKRLTTGHVIIMGRKTHDSIARALPGRRNIVLSRQPDYAPAQGCELAHGLDDLLELLDGELRHCFVIGGSAIYEMLMPWTTRCVLTVVDVTIQGGDAYLPALDESGWRAESSTPHGADERHDHAFVVHDLRRVDAQPWRDAQGGAVPQPWRVRSV